MIDHAASPRKWTFRQRNLAGVVRCMVGNGRSMSVPGFGRVTAAIHHRRQGRPQITQKHADRRILGPHGRSVNVTKPGMSACRAFAIQRVPRRSTMEHVSTVLASERQMPGNADDARHRGPPRCESLPILAILWALGVLSGPRFAVGASCQASLPNWSAHAAARVVTLFTEELPAAMEAQPTSRWVHSPLTSRQRVPVGFLSCRVGGRRCGRTPS